MTVATDVQPLVLSWSGVLSQLFAGTITLDELDGALFYFGCTKEHAFTPEASNGPNELEEITRSDPERGKKVHAELMRAVREAEAHDRVAWRALDERPSWNQLNQLLGRFGLPPVDASSGAENLNLPDAHRLIREQSLPYRAISVPGVD